MNLICNRALRKEQRTRRKSGYFLFLAAITTAPAIIAGTKVIATPVPGFLLVFEPLFEVLLSETRPPLLLSLTLSLLSLIHI